eukprot:CAMPEP_0177762520 /NCGR_PEP_ID=MMETSP0491_2-20121128/6390_1 /TAXON_ID=63592 /ORGANISM="Tetraselmis chuii, Strain PLY429" /LENGTH=171 /DNA_ID=CAMNT_0019278583 /DNA_START=316 /DNA_END=831 /DNA_ORIENTATION=-
MATAAGGSAVDQAAAASASADVDFRYWRLWVSADGHTHLTPSTMSGFEEVGYSKSPQAVREKGIPPPRKVVFTELPAQFDNPWHFCPASQFVTVQRGQWWVKTTDGSKQRLGPNDVLYQDNTSDIMDKLKDGSSALIEHAGQHCSGTDGETCQQIIIQVDREPCVGEKVPF